LARDEKLVQPEKPALSPDNIVAGRIKPNPGWLKEVWGKWPGDESIEELLAALDDANKR
jgi:hypothetical protein